jgi:hypothetical protein
MIPEDAKSPELLTGRLPKKDGAKKDGAKKSAAKKVAKKGPAK